MAGQVLSLSDPEVVNAWETDVDLETRALDPLLDPANGLAGPEGSGALIVQKDQLVNEPGAFIVMKQGYQLEGSGKAKDAVLKGNEEAYKTATQNVYVDTLRHAFAISSPITQQWVPEDVLETGKTLLGDWMASRQSFSLHAHATGCDFITLDQYRLNNTIAAVNSSYVIRPNAKTAGNLTSSDTFDIDLLNEAAMYVRALRPKILPASTPWGPKFCVFISPAQARDLRKSDTVWFAKMSSAAAGGQIEMNGLYTRYLGQEQDFLIFESDFIPPGHNSGGTAFKDKTARAWIGGAGALAHAFGRGYRWAPGFAPNRYQWVKDSEDYSHQNSIGVATISGAIRRRFQKPGESSAREAGVLVLETYADRGSIGSDDMYRDWINAGATVDS